MTQHLRQLKKGENLGTPSFKEDFCKYGADDFDGYILEEGVAPAKFREREAFWIRKYKATDSRYGYNKDAMEERPSLKIVAGRPPLPNPEVQE